MGPKPQRRGLQTPTKVSPDAKKLKTDSNKVRGRENSEENVNNNLKKTSTFMSFVYVTTGLLPCLC